MKSEKSQSLVLDTRKWLESDKEALKGTVKSLPTREAIDVPVNEMLIVELYSK